LDIRFSEAHAFGDGIDVAELSRMPSLLYLPPLSFAAAFLLYAGYAAIFGAERTERFDKLALGPWLPRVFLEFGYFLYRIPVRACIALGITADMLTGISVVLAACGALAIARGSFTLGGWTLLAAFTCDGMDGVVARATGTVSKRGEFIDSVADHYTDLVAYSGYAYYYRDRIGVLLLVALTMVGSSVVSYSRSKGAALGVDTNVGYMRRFERAVWLGGGTVLAPIVARLVEPHAVHPTYHVVVAVMALLALLTHLTIWMRSRVIIAALPKASQIARGA
jgi:CDP-diacylglycerol--glycerol-3-phosphate 3-phosphatidyltransferase